jgi:endonuclease/exonuclease/phosphatase family metal-dependent hydrolase
VARPDASLRIVQLNIGSLLEPDWDRRRHEIVAWLDELRPDVACFEEVWESDSAENTARWIAAQLPSAGYDVAFGGDPFAASFGGDPSMRFGSAVLSRWPIDGHEYHRLPVADGAEPFVAGIPWELLHARTAGLDVFVCHLAPAPTHGLHRRRQVLAIDDLIRSVRGRRDDLPRSPAAAAEMPPILCGDFNAEPDSDEIRFLSSLTVLEGRTTFFQDAWRVAGDGGPGYTQDWRWNELAAGLNVHRKRIDYVFVGDPFMRAGTGRVLAASLAFHTPKTGVLASDHAGLVVDVQWPALPEES